jgi:beta-lactamase class A
MIVMFFQKSARFDAMGQQLVREALDGFGSRGLAADKLGLTWLIHPHDRGRMFGDGAGLPLGYSYNGDAPFYPCSVVKVFYLIAAQAALEAGRIAQTPMLDCAMHDMIKWSSNTATNYIIDIVTGTTGDTDLTPEEMAPWVVARNSINEYFKSLDLPELDGINVSQKLMDDDRYGREKVFVQLGGNNHNRLTTDAAASMLARLIDGSMASPERSQVMIDYLFRPRDAGFVQTPGAQVLGYLGENMPAAARIWSKAGWTGWTRDPLASYRRHDAIHAALPDGQAFTLVVFTQGQQISTDLSMLPFIGKRACELMAAT